MWPIFKSPASRAATFHLRRLNLVYAVCLLCEHTTGCETYSFTTDGYGIFNLRTNSGACRTHEMGSDTNKSVQELDGRDIIFFPCSSSGLPRQGIEPRVFVRHYWPLSYVPRPPPSSKRWSELGTLQFDCSFYSVLHQLTFRRYGRNRRRRRKLCSLSILETLKQRHCRQGERVSGGSVLIPTISYWI